MILLTSDWHLDDNPANEYRWAVFNHLSRWLEENKENHLIFHLGDLTDRKDRHSAALVNRLTSEFTKLTDVGAVIYILMGNHDKPLNGVPFWQFLTEMSDYLTFVTHPLSLPKMGLALLPYSDNPKEEWAHIDFKKFKAAFMHQTVTGAVGNNGFVLEDSKVPGFPVKLKVYSGDIHTTQVVKRVKYVGSPHPVAFGDNYPCQMLELDEQLNIVREIKTPTIQKHMLRIESPDDLARVDAWPGDQAHVICKLPIEAVDLWPAMQDAISAWAHKEAVILFSVVPEIEGTKLAREADEAAPLEGDLEYILRLFADAESIDDRMFEVGVALLKEALG